LPRQKKTIENQGENSKKGAGNQLFVSAIFVFSFFFPRGANRGLFYKIYQKLHKLQAKVLMK
jgi:hypothetical protein